MSIITSEQKNQIIALTNAKTPNREICEIVGIKLPTLLYWKNVFRKRGVEILTPPKGRPVKPKLCPHCGEPI